MHRLHFLLRCLFSRSFRTAWPGRRRGAWRRRAGAGSFGDSRSAARHDSLLGFSGLESRAMLAADDVFVSLVGNQVVLGFDPAGTAITDLNTSYNAAANVLTITAAHRGHDLDDVAGFGDHGRRRERHDRGRPEGDQRLRGHQRGGRGRRGRRHDRLEGREPGRRHRRRLRAELRHRHGEGATDRITVAAAVSSKGAGGVSLTTLGTGPGLGIQLAAGVTAPLGPQTFAGAVTLQNNTSLTAGNKIFFSSKVDGASRLTLSSGDAITFSGAIGGTTPLRGITLSAAKSVAFAGAMKLDGTGTGANTSGLVIGANVNNVVFSAASGSNARTIRKLRRQRHPVRGRLDRLADHERDELPQPHRPPGRPRPLHRHGDHGQLVHLRTPATASCSQPPGGILLGGAAAGAGNTIIFNGGYGLNATGTSTGSVVAGQPDQQQHPRQRAWPADQHHLRRYPRRR